MLGFSAAKCHRNLDSSQEKGSRTRVTHITGSEACIQAHDDVHRTIEIGQIDQTPEIDHEIGHPIDHGIMIKGDRRKDPDRNLGIGPGKGVTVTVKVTRT
jgi:hypothetical protein